MTETTKLPASFSNSSVFEGSTAFLMVQKNNNKRQTSMTDDVFRIFRRTGKKISQIANQIEKERGVYLKESYNNKNALYKELASIPSVKETNGRRRGKVQSQMLPLPRFADVHTSDLICRPVKSQLSRQRQGQETELEPEKRINVNVLKRCECCRRLAFRYKEMSLKMLNMKEKEEEEKKENPKNVFKKSKSAMYEALETLQSRQSYGKHGNEETRQFQYSSRKTSESRISANQRVDRSFKSLKQQSSQYRHSPTPAQPRSLTTAPIPTNFTRASTRERSWSVIFDKCSFILPPEPSPSPFGRQKIRVKFKHPHLKEKLKVCGKEWTNHLLELKGRGKEEKQTVVALSKAYLDFKKLLHKMEEQRKTEEEMEKRSYASEYSSYEVDSPTSRNENQSDVCNVALLAWQPSRRSSRTHPSLQKIEQISAETTKETNSY